MPSSRETAIHNVPLELGMLDDPEAERVIALLKKAMYLLLLLRRTEDSERLEAE